MVIFHSSVNVYQRVPHVAQIHWLIIILPIVKNGHECQKKKTSVEKQLSGSAPVIVFWKYRWLGKLTKVTIVGNGY